MPLQNMSCPWWTSRGVGNARPVPEHILAQAYARKDRLYCFVIRLCVRTGRIPKGQMSAENLAPEFSLCDGDSDAGQGSDAVLDPFQTHDALPVITSCLRRFQARVTLATIAARALRGRAVVSGDHAAGPGLPRWSLYREPDTEFEGSPFHIPSTKSAPPVRFRDGRCGAV